jgi:hypothetical protein
MTRAPTSGHRSSSRDVLSANCVTDQTERPQIVIKDGKYYLFTISHRGMFAAGIDGPEACTASSTTASAATSSR